MSVPFVPVTRVDGGPMPRRSRSLRRNRIFSLQRIHAIATNFFELALRVLKSVQQAFELYELTLLRTADVRDASNYERVDPDPPALSDSDLLHRDTRMIVLYFLSVLAIQSLPSS
ncbi:hypothetical protein CC2G_007782 [Coprinopsis cinerea AmutBmut pab1-1]|nr:hypothetical protein CC2G_007782 [Coprinopsis cinerea AmutBmut pab1-1]